MLLIAVAVGVLAFLAYKTQSVDLERHSRIIETLRDLKQLDVKWSEDTLRARLLLDQDYDRLTHPLAALKENRLLLTEGPLAIANTAWPEVDSAMTNYMKTMKGKEEMVELFKSQNSVLRNSMSFLPTAVKSLMDTAIDDYPDITGQARSLLAKVLEYNGSPSASLEGEIRNIIQSLRDRAPSLSGEIADLLETVVNHSSMALLKKIEVDNLMRELATIPSVQHMDDLTSRYVVQHERQLVAVNKYRLILAGYGALLIAIILFIGYRLRFTNVALDLSNQALHQANDTLEAKVGQRTNELKSAYENLRSTELNLMQSDKMASLGTMVAGVAHEINTPLAYVRANVEGIIDQLPSVDKFTEETEKLTYLLRDSEDEEAISEQFNVLMETLKNFKESQLLEDTESALKDSVYGIDEIAKMVVNLKDFSRLDREKIANHDVHEGIESTLMIAHNTLKHKVQVIKQFGENIPRIVCSPSQINQVLLNLFVNAAQAYEDYGRLLVKTTAGEEYVNILIRDDGRGIDEKDLPHIFEPFYTTKEVGQGTGLGLSIAQKIIDDHKGKISVVSKKGEGTQFMIWLPIEQQRVESDLQDADSGQLPKVASV